MQKLLFVVVAVSHHCLINMYITRYYLGVRDKKDWSKWSFSPEFDSFAKCANKYAKWLETNPGRVVSFMTKRVFVPDSKPAK